MPQENNVNRYHISHVFKSECDHLITWPYWRLFIFLNLVNANSLVTLWKWTEHVRFQNYSLPNLNIWVKFTLHNDTSRLFKYPSYTNKHSQIIIDVFLNLYINEYLIKNLIDVNRLIYS